MDKKEQYTLEILTKIEENSRVTQPEIARQLGISIGLTNSFIKRIARKGYIKLTTIPRDRAKYLLTTQGISEKSRLTLKYLQYSLNFYKKAKETISNVYEGLHKDGVKIIAFYGAGEIAEIAYILLHQNQMKLSGVVDEHHAGKKFMRLKVGKLEDLKKLSFDKIIVTSIRSTEDIGSKIRGAGISEDKILFLDELTVAKPKKAPQQDLQPEEKAPA